MQRRNPPNVYHYHCPIPIHRGLLYWGIPCLFVWGVLFLPATRRYLNPDRSLVATMCNPVPHLPTPLPITAILAPSHDPHRPPNAAVPALGAPVTGTDPHPQEPPMIEASGSFDSVILEGGDRQWCTVM